MAWAYILLTVVGLGLIVLGFYGGFVRKGTKAISAAFSLLIPVGLVLALLGVLLTVLPNFFKDPQW